MERTDGPLELRFDGRVRALYIRVSKTNAGGVKTTQIEPEEVLVDRDRSGAIIGFEILIVDRPRLAKMFTMLRERFVGEVPQLAQLELVGAKPRRRSTRPPATG